MNEKIVWVIITIAIVFTVLAIVDKSPYENLPSHRGQPTQNFYEECVPDPFWGSCLP